MKFHLLLKLQFDYFESYFHEILKFSYFALQVWMSDRATGNNTRI